MHFAQRKSVWQTVYASHSAPFGRSRPRTWSQNAKALWYQGQEQNLAWRPRTHITAKNDGSATSSCCRLFMDRCSCLDWQHVSITSPGVIQASQHVVAMVNNMTSSHAELCARLSLGNTTSAVRYVMNEQVLKFRQSSDIHGRVADFSDTMKPSTVRLHWASS